MTIACPAPDQSLGTVLRLSTYLDCQGRALGENGFEALTGGPILSAALSAALTIFVALIGYRLILGATPTLRQGVGWAIRVGLVLALTAGWPAFRTLVYAVATDGPAELASTLLDATGLPGSDADARLQRAYDAVGRGAYLAGGGSDESSDTTAPPASLPGQPAPSTIVSLGRSPVTAALLAVSGIGATAALRLAVGLLVAIGPLAMLALLFDGTLGVFAGWLRALAGSALGVMALTISGSIETMLLESEIARATALQSGALGSGAADAQAFMTIAGVFSLVALVLVYASYRAAAGLRIAPLVTPDAMPLSPRVFSSRLAALERSTRPTSARSPVSPATAPTRAASIAGALASAASRDAAFTDSGFASRPTRVTASMGRPSVEAARAPSSLGRAGRRTSVRRTQTAALRDRPS